MSISIVKNSLGLLVFGRPKSVDPEQATSCGPGAKISSHRMYSMSLVNCSFSFLLEEVVLLGDGNGPTIDEVSKSLAKMPSSRFRFGKRLFCSPEKWCAVVTCLVTFKLGVTPFCNSLSSLWLSSLVEDFLGRFAFLVVDTFLLVFWLFDSLELMSSFKMYSISSASFSSDMVNSLAPCFVEYLFVFETLWNILRV